jgi:MYXO-CTERM domain-containing protein
MYCQLVPPKLAGVIAGVLLSLSAAAKAQVGTGWTPYDPPERVQTRGCATYGAEGGVERFGLTCDAASGDNRAEQRIENDYSSGTNQFDGEVRVVSIGGMNVSIKQTFMPNNGAFLMIAVGGDGRLYSVGDGAGGELATGVIGRWVRISTVHDVGAGTHEIYVDGALKFTKRGGRQVSWHDKYGTYRLGSGRGPIVAEWRNVKYWRGGRGGGGSSPPLPGDAGQPDAVTEDGPISDGATTMVDASGTGGGAGTGGASGSGGAAGSGSGGTAAGGASGSGGAAGSGGMAGRGGRDAAPPSSGGNAGDSGDGKEPGGCSCEIGHAPRVGRGPGLALVGLLALAAIRRRLRSVG